MWPSIEFCCLENAKITGMYAMYWAGVYQSYWQTSWPWSAWGLCWIWVAWAARARQAQTTKAKDDHPSRQTFVSTHIPPAAHLAPARKQPTGNMRAPNSDLETSCNAPATSPKPWCSRKQTLLPLVRCVASHAIWKTIQHNYSEIWNH